MERYLWGSGLTAYVIRRLAGPFWLRRRQLHQTQWYSSTKLEALQLDLLRKLLVHAYRYIPHYHRIMDERGVRPDAVDDLSCIKAFPILTKEGVLQAGEDLVSRRWPVALYRKAYTGGTTGTPVCIRRTLFSIGSEHAFLRRQWDWAGISMRDRCAYLTGRVICPPDQEQGSMYAYDPVMRDLILSTYHLTAERALEYAQAIRRYGIKALVGYPTAIYMLARSCIDAGYDLPIQSILTSSETLTASMRELITEAFGCQIYDYYGSAERVCYIHTCDLGRYHVIPEYGLTELIPLDPRDPLRCRVVSTGFWNYAMPFIRYDLGDIVHLSEDRCACGRAFPVVESIEGRQADTIVTPSGREFGAAILTHLLYGTDNIVESQIVQDRIDHVYINYVPGQAFSKRDLEALQGLVVKHLPTELEVTLNRVEGLPRTARGKLKPIVSQL